MSGLRIVVLGMMGRDPFAGVAWQLLHYLEGLRRLGHDVWYVEDTGAWPFDPDQNTYTDDPRYATDYLRRVLRWMGLEDRWAYVAPDRSVFGLSESRLDDVLATADALLNVTGATVLREEHMRTPVRIYLETDPVLPQIEVALGRQWTIDMLEAHTHHFSFGENLGADDCPVPVERFTYLPTRQPVVVDWWREATPAGSRSDPGRFTTVASWRQSSKDIEWKGETYLWSKHAEFERFMELPNRTSQTLELALSSSSTEAIARLQAHGWRVVDGVALSREILPYRDYMRGSGAEFTVAKDQYARLRSGWFSDRSACYLAAGRPVVTQDTAFENVLPTGLGLFPFSTMDEILTAFDAITGDYRRHSEAAGEIAAEYFEARRVVGALLEAAGL